MYVLTLVRMNVCLLTSVLNQIVFTIAANTSIHTVYTYIHTFIHTYSTYIHTEYAHAGNVALWSQLFTPHS